MKSKSAKNLQNGLVCLVEYITEYDDSAYEYSEGLYPEGLTFVYNADEMKNNDYNQFSLAFSQIEEGDSAALRLQLPADFIKKSEENNMPTRDHIITYMRLKRFMSEVGADVFNARISARAMLDLQKWPQGCTIKF